MNQQDAEEFTLSLGQIVAGSWRQIALAQRLGVPKALGLTTKEWVEDRLGGYIKMAKAEKAKAVEELKSEGHSTRDIGSILGVHPTDPMITNRKAAENSAPDPHNDDGNNLFTAENSALDTIAALNADEALHIEARKQQQREEKRAANEALKASPASIPVGKYSTLIIDPPWDMVMIERDVRPDQAAFDYPTMTLDELAAFGPTVRGVAADDCHLFMWSTQKFLPDALKLIEHWGFRYVLTMVWHKAGGYQPVGLPQYNCEFVLYARLGSPRFSDTKAFDCCFSGRRREHSRKPDEFYDLIRRVTDAPRLDMFSREKREGFDQYGNETERFIGGANGRLQQGSAMGGRI